MTETMHTEPNDGLAARNRRRRLDPPSREPRAPNTHAAAGED